MNELSLLAINLTRRCNLACAHCYLDAESLRSTNENELTTAQVCNLLDDVTECGDGTMVVLTGGEPLIRRDIEEIVTHGAQLGLAMVVGTNGMLLTQRRVASLQRAGLLGVGISVDSLEPGKHDAFRGQVGSWARTMTGIEHCRSQGLSFQIHFSVTSGNADELPVVIDFARESGARVLNVFFLICTGRGETLSDISPQRYEQILVELIAAQANHPNLIIRPRCAPQYKRIAYQLNPASGLNRISGREIDGCIAGTHYCRITPEGGVTACPYISDVAGYLGEQSLREIWEHAEEFQRLRSGQLRGVCGGCEYQKLCGGCRARPLAAGGDSLDTDPGCCYVPQGGAVIEPFRPLTGHPVRWNFIAEERLEKIPGFLRNMIRKRAEAYVLGIGETTVTAEHLAVLSARRFGGKPPIRPPL